MKKSLAVTLLLALGGVGRCVAQDAAPKVDPAYAAAVTRMAGAIAALPAYAVDVKLEWKGGDGDAGSTLFNFRLERPGKFRIEARPEADKGGPTLVAASDGSHVTTYLPARKLYTRVPLDDPGRALENSPLVASSIKGSLIDSLMRPDLKDFILERSRDARLVAKEAVDGQSLEHFHLTWGRDEEEFWLGPEGQTLPRKLSRVTLFPGRDEAALKLTTTATLTWTLDKPADPKAFVIDLPADARKVDDLEAALIGGAGESLVGKPVPALTLPKLGGGEVKLGELKGKGPVVLAFWASYHPGSLDALPALAKLRDEFKAKGVSALAVNLGEDAPAIASALKDKKPAMDVLMDPEGAAIEAFGVTAVPTFVLIDKDGLVRAVRVGPGEGDALLKAVHDDLEALAAGRAPLQEAPKP